MKRWSSLAFLAAALVGLPVIARAEPTPVQSRLVWDHDGSGDVTGFVLYWALQSEPEPRVYSDARRVLINGAATREAVVIDAKPDATGGLCFRLTAINAAGQESAFSNEACGFFGLPVPINVRVE